MIAMVPISVAAGLILASAGAFVCDDIAQVRSDSVALSRR